MNVMNPARMWTGNPSSRNIDAILGAGGPTGRSVRRRSPPVRVAPRRAHLDSTTVTYVYAFDHKHRRPPMEYKDLLGGKGANLAEMTSVLKLPVPPGFTISTDACRAYMEGGWPKGLDDEIAKQVAKLEKQMKRTLGDADDPLLVSVRSGAKFSMPGMMDTVLNLGLNDKSVKGLAKSTDRRALRLRQLPPVHRDVRAHRARRRRRAVRPSARSGARGRPASKTDAEIGAAELKQLCEHYKAVVKEATGKAFPQNPTAQLRGAVEAVFRSWNGPRAIAYRVRERIEHTLGTAVNVQAMVFGNRDDNSGTGVGFTRNAATGENKPYGDFLVNAQGEDVVAGIRNTAGSRPSSAAGVPDDPRRAAGDLRSARSALPRHVRHRVHDRSGQALDAADPRRQAHRRRRAADGRRHDQGHRQG